MQYIDKLSNSEIAECLKEYSAHFIEGQWQEDAKRYVNLTYDSIDKQIFCEKLSEEQNDYCCYCMKKMSVHKRNITLEHVIPHNLSRDRGEDYNQYTMYAALNPELVKWIPPREQSNITEKLTLPPYPHYIAYENLVASCDGYIVTRKESNQTCNHKRGDTNIPPLFFMENIAEIMDYGPDGDVGTRGDEYKNVIDKTLNLNDESLKFARKIWYGLNKMSAFLKETFPIAFTTSEQNIVSYLMGDGHKEDRAYVADKLAQLGIIDLNKRRDLGKIEYWQLIEEFSWFDRYYADVVGRE